MNVLEKGIKLNLPQNYHQELSVFFIFKQRANTTSIVNKKSVNTFFKWKTKKLQNIERDIL